MLYFKRSFKEALAAIGSTTVIVNLLVVFFNGFSVGAASAARICPPCRIYRFRAGIRACPESGAAAEIPRRLLLPLAAAARNPPAPV
jgi:hypothetical protein